MWRLRLCSMLLRMARLATLRPGVLTISRRGSEKENETQQEGESSL